MGDPQEALLCFWAAGIYCKERILPLHNTYPDIGTNLEYQMMETLAASVVKKFLPLMNRILCSRWNETVMIAAIAHLFPH